MGERESGDGKGICGRSQAHFWAHAAYAQYETFST